MESYGLLMVLLMVDGSTAITYVPAPARSSLQECQRVALSMETDPPADMREDKSKKSKEPPFSILRARCIINWSI